MIIDVNSGFQNRQIEQSICTPEIFNKILELFNIPQVSDVLVKDNAMYREVFRMFIGEHEEILKTVHENLVKSLDAIEEILGPLKDATDYRPSEDSKKESSKEQPKEVTRDNIRSLDHGFTDNERLMYLYCTVRNYCSIVKYNRRLEYFLSQDISATIERLVQLRRAIIMGGIVQYRERIREDLVTHKDAIQAFDKKVEEEQKEQRKEIDLKEVIGKLSREEYNKKYAKVHDLNYCIATFEGVLEFDESKRTNLEREAEICQTEIFKLVITCWKKKIPNNQLEIPKKNINSIVNSVIYMSELFTEDSLLKTFDPAHYSLAEFDSCNFMASIVKSNQVVEEYTKLMTTDAPYVTDLYMHRGFKNVFTLYHWYRKVTPILENLDDKRILLSKHMQLLWSNIGDLFATTVEGKFYKEAREVFALVTEKHKSDSEFLSSVYYHICSEVFKQEDIITYFLTHSKFFLECLIDIMKMLITEDFGEAVQRDNRRPHAFLGGRYGANVPRQGAAREYDDQTISQITDIGYPRRLAIEALNRTHGRIELAIDYVLSLPPGAVDEFRNEEAKSPAQNEDVKMEPEDKKEEDDDMDVDESGIVVCNKDDLAKAIKNWLKMLFNWVLKGFNSTLTDIDVENITNFILKYISTEDDVQVLMTHLIESLTQVHDFLLDTQKDISDINYQKERNSCLKKASTLSKILSYLSKYFLTNVGFIEKLTNCLTKLFEAHKTTKMNFVSKDKEHKLYEIVDGETPKTEADIFTDIIGNCMNIIIAGYGFYKLSCSDDTKAAIEKELQIKEESKGDANKEKDTEKDKKSKYDPSVINYFKDIKAIQNSENTQENDKSLQRWKEKFTEQHFMKLSMLMIEYSGENFDECFSPDSFNRFMYLLVKLLEERQNIEVFTEDNGFKKLLNLKSYKRKIADKARTHFTNIVIKLIEDESALLEITENVIRKTLFFKHDEEFTKETKEKTKDTGSKKKSKDKRERSKSKEKKDPGEEEKKDEVEEEKDVVEEDKKEATEEEKKDPTEIKKSTSEGILTKEPQSLITKPKVTKSESTMLKKSDITFNVFRNCSGVKLSQFLEQMKFIEAKTSSVFLKACSNLCEIENIKEYDCELNVKSEYKIIKLKDTVLKDYIAKVTKESSASHKNLPPAVEKKEATLAVQPKAGSQTARVKQAPPANLTGQSKKDNFLISSLMSTQTFFPKPNRNIILMIIDKIVDKFCNGNFENWYAATPADEKEFESQCIFSYAMLLGIINKVVRTYPSTASLVMLFKSKKLKHFQSFIEFLVKKIYPVGFWKWTKHNPNSTEELKKFEEVWKQGDIKDNKGDMSREEDDKLFNVSWEKNSEWENVIVENMRTLIDYNIFMSPQEKKIKLEIKKHLLTALLDKVTHKSTYQNSLRNITIISTCLILLRKMLTVSESNQPLCYNKENVCHTIKELKSTNKVFKILSDLMRSVNPLSPEAEILNPMLIPLIDRMTFSEDMKTLGQKELEEEKKQQELEDQMAEDDDSQDDMNIDDDDGIDIDIEIDEDEDEDEQDDEEHEGEEAEGEGEPFVEENATESENLSLEDMIEELEYGEEEDDESEDDSDDLQQVEIVHDQEMEVDDDGEGDMIEEELDSDEASEMIDQVNEAAAMGFIEENDDDIDEFDEQADDQEDPYNVIEIEEHPHVRGGGLRHFVDIDDEDEEDDLLNSQAMNDMGLHQILHMLQRRDPAGGRAGLFARNRHLGNGAYHMGIGGAARRRPRQVNNNDPRRGLESLFQIVNQERVENDNDFWESNMNANAGENSNRQRQNRVHDDGLGNPYGGLLSREFQHLRDELLDQRAVGDRNIGLNRARQRERERNDNRNSNNPFEILRNLQHQYRDTTENKLEQVCEVNVIDKRPTKEEIDKYNKEKEELKKEKEQLESAEKKDDKQNESNESKDDSDQNEIVERMDAMGLRRASEDHPEGQEEPVNQNQPDNTGANEEVKEDINLESADAHSSTMHVDDNRQPSNEEENKQNINTEEVKANSMPQTNQPAPQQPAPQQPAPQQPALSEADRRINNILETFNVTRQQVQNSGIDLDVLQYLPEFELVSILSEVASSAPQDAPNQPEQNQNAEAPQNQENQQPLVEEHPQNEPQELQNQPVAQPESRPQNPFARQPEAQSQPQPSAQSNPAPTRPSPSPAQSQNDPMLNDFFNSLLGAQASNLNNSIGQAVNPPPNQQNNPMSAFNEAFQNALMGMNAGMNPPQQPFSQLNFNQPPNPFGMPPNPFSPNRQAQSQPVPRAQPPRAGANVPADPQQNQPAQPEANQAPALPEGIDQEFFNSLPEEMKQELLRDNDMLRRNLGQPPPEPADIGHAEQMDTASFLATITDENLRREILIGMDENTIATLPGRMQNEARRYQREIYRRQYRRERDDHPAGFLRRMMERGHDRDAIREMRNRHGDRNEEAKREKYDNFMDIIKRREEKYSRATPEAADISQNTINVVFNDDKNLKNLMKIIIIESQRKNQIRFERLTKPFENLCNNTIIRSKLNQCLMQILNNFKYFSYCVQYSHMRRPNLLIDHIFPPVFIVNDETRSIEEIQYPKIALLVFKIFNNETNKYSSNNNELIKSFFTKEQKKSYNQVQSWFTTFEKDRIIVNFIEDSPFLCLLKYILSDDFYTNQNDMSEMLKIASNLIKKFMKPIKDKVLTVDSETLEVLFKLITLKIEQDFIKQICVLFYTVSLNSEELIFENIKKAILNTIPEVEEQIKDEIKERQREVAKSQASQASQEESKQKIEEIKSAFDPDEEIIDISSVPYRGRPHSLSMEGPSTQAIVQETREKSLALEKAPKLERLLKVFKMLLHQFSKHSRNTHMSEEEKNKGKQLKENGFKIIDLPELKQLFATFGDYLAMLSESDINDSVKMIGLSMFLCYQEDFKKIDQQVFTEDFNKPHIEMQDYHLADRKSVPNIIDEKFLKDKRIVFFVELCTKNNKIFNTLIRQNQFLIRDSLKHMIYVVPQIFDFDNKHHFFRQEIKKMKRVGAYDSIRISVNRNRMFRIFEESFEQMNPFSADEWKGKVEVTFAGERGQDAGGLMREWFTEISKQMLNPNLGLFKLSDSGSTYYPNPKSSFVQNEHLQYFRFIGRIIGKALLEEQYIECSFVKVLYKIIRGTPISWHDVEDFDNTYYNNLKWLLDNDAEILQQTFCETIDFFGRPETHDLIENGRNVNVTNENKKEYIQKVSFFKLYTSIKDQIDAFLKGFYELIPRKLISIFDHGELELLISGLPTIDLDDMRANSEYSGYKENSQIITWFWEAMNELTNPERAEFLQFVTGSSKVPIEGFVALQGMRGPHKFNIHKIYDADFNRLPVAHTCFNQLDMPDYPSKELLKERLLYAIREGKGSFQIA